jgi:hypothetical protein
VEYTYKNSVGEKPITVVLNDYAIQWQSGGAEKLIPYANILSVRLTRSGKKFLTIIKTVDKAEVQISNLFYFSNNQSEDRSRQYATFVRVLHYHLKDKSIAYYVCGNNLKTLLIAACIFVVASFGVSYILEKYNANPWNSNITALSLSIAGILAIVLYNWGLFPNVYKPTEIPQQFLPST